MQANFFGLNGMEVSDHHRGAHICRWATPAEVCEAAARKMRQESSEVHASKAEVSRASCRRLRGEATGDENAAGDQGVPSDGGESLLEPWRHEHSSPN